MTDDKEVKRGYNYSKYLLETAKATGILGALYLTFKAGGSYEITKLMVRDKDIADSVIKYYNSLQRGEGITSKSKNKGSIRSGFIKSAKIGAMIALIPITAGFVDELSYGGGLGDKKKGTNWKAYAGLTLAAAVPLLLNSSYPYNAFTNSAGFFDGQASAGNFIRMNRLNYHHNF